MPCKDIACPYTLLKNVSSSTVGANITGPTKIRNKFWYPLKIVNFPILQ